MWILMQQATLFKKIKDLLNLSLDTCYLAEEQKLLLAGRDQQDSLVKEIKPLLQLNK